MQVLITGISGFVGARLARHLAAHGHEVSGTFIHESPNLEGIEVFEVDLRDAAGLARAVERTSPESIIHLAGLSHVGASWSQPETYFQVNVLGSENLFRAAAGVPILAASSAEVYGLVQDQQQPIPEDRPLAPRSPYALTKAAMERLALLHGAVIVRSFNIVGPGQVESFALPAFAAQLAAIERQKEPPVLRVGNLEARRDFLHVDDAVEGYRVLLERGEQGRAYNLGSGRAYSIRQALDQLIETSGLKPQIEVDSARFRPVDLPLLQAATERLQGLGWTVKKGLGDALEDLWRAAQKSSQHP
jgi:GDP-4-dehydro-6-deoxy-D-mannose reductase